jgi:hypothetical protein
MSKKQRLQPPCLGEEKSAAISRGWGENGVRELLTDLVGSAMDAPIDGSALARRRALLKNTIEKAPSSINVIHDNV